MKIKNQPKLKFLGVDIASVDFKSGKPFDDIRKKPNLKFGIEPKIFLPENQPACFKIIMNLFLEIEGHFKIDLLAIGNFEIKNADANSRNSFININAPAIMFPYVRAFVATLTANMGRSAFSLNLPTQFFHGELEEIKEEID